MCAEERSHAPSKIRVADLRSGVAVSACICRGATTGGKPTQIPLDSAGATHKVKSHLTLVDVTATDSKDKPALAVFGSNNSPRHVKLKNDTLRLQRA
jgi:hypothetical protein